MPSGAAITSADERDDQAADDRVEQAADDAGRSGHLGEDVERQSAEAFPQQRAQDQHEPGEAERGREIGEPGPDRVAALASGIESGHQRPAFTSRRASIRRAAARTRNVMMKRMKPSASSDDGEEPGIGVRELIGDHRGDRRALRQDRSLDLGRVADDEGHRHGLAQRAPEREHHAADDADAGVGDDDVADDLEGRAADAICGLLEHGRHGVEHVARDRGDERQDHHRQNQPGGQDAVAERRTLEQDPDAGNEAERLDQERLDIGLHERLEVIDAPDAVDDRGNAGEQFDRDADRAAQRRAGRVRSGTRRCRARPARRSPSR